MDEIDNPHDQKEKRSVHRTQWAAQFAVASELCKQGYEVAFTMGNHPEVDLMVISPEGRSFHVDVKGLYKRNFWVVKPKPSRAKLFYILAFVPDDEPNRFFVLSQAEVNREVPRHLDRIRRNRAGKGLPTDKVGVMQGLSWTFAEKFEGKWKKLPK
jgi:hypothetical protein